MPAGQKGALRGVHTGGDRFERPGSQFVRLGRLDAGHRAAEVPSALRRLPFDPVERRRRVRATLRSGTSTNDHIREREDRLPQWSLFDPQ